MSIIKKTCIIIFCLMVSITAKAVIADPTPHLETLPDGRTIEVVLHGDEYYSYKTDLQGNIVVGNLPSASEQARISQRKAARKLGGHFPLTGTPHSLVLLAEYPDLKFTCTKQDFDSLLMQSGYNKNGGTGSCRDYFIASSDSSFQPIFDVYGPFEVSENMAYYGENGDKNAHKLIIEACQLAYDSGVDFTQYDTDNDGIIDNIFVYYAGHNEAEGASDNTIWPHQSNLSSLQVYIQGKKIASYACTSELKGSSGKTQCAIGTFCHEFGHVLGLPDWYDTSENNKYTIGDWSIMSSGNYNNKSRTPPSYNAYERFYLGWLKPQQLMNEGMYQLAPLTLNNEAYLIATSTHNLEQKNPNPSEFFILENRQQVGWDEPYMPGTGMLVWHVDYSAYKWNQNTPNVKDPMGLHLEEAKGRRNTAAMTDPYPGTGNVTSFIPKLHNGTMLEDQPIFNIEQIGNDIYFIYKSSGENHIQATPDSITFLVHKKANGKSIDWSPVPIHLYGEHISPTERITVTTGSGNFYITTSDSVMQTEANREWQHTFILEDAVRPDSTLDTVFYACYKINRFTCAEEKGLITISSWSNHLTIPLIGNAPLLSDITTPTIEAETDITPYAFTINWSAVSDAMYYDIEAYQSSAGDTTFVQDFEDFDNIDAIHKQGWESTTTSITSSTKKDGQYALYLKRTDDQIITQAYPAPVTKISIWLEAIRADVDSIGKLQIEGSSDGKQWNTIETIFINRRTKDKTCSYDIDKKNGYVLFRLTYINLGGQGIALDAWEATISEKITYLYAEHPITIPIVQNASNYRFIFNNLMPNCTYQYQIRCSDGGIGCKEVVTPYSEIRSVTTLDGADPESNRLTIGIMSYDVASRVIYIPQFKEDYSLLVFDITGRMIWSTEVKDGQCMVQLPDTYFIKGHVYIAKYMATNKMTRDAKWVKFIYK